MEVISTRLAAPLVLLMTSLVNSLPQQDFFSDEDSGGGASNSSTVVDFVADIPDFVSTNNTLTAIEGSTLTLSCQVNKLSSYQIIWYKRRTEMEEWKVLRIGQTPVAIKKNDPRFSFTSNSTILRISNIEMADQGLYKCEVAVTNTPKIYLDVKVVAKREVSERGRQTSGGVMTTATQAAFVISSSVLYASLVNMF